MNSILFFLLPISYVLQNPTLLPYDEIKNGFKIYHVIIIFLILFSIGKSDMEARKYSGLYFFSIVISIIASMQIDIKLLNAFLFILAFVSASGANFKEIKYARNGFIVACLLICSSMIIQLPTIIESSSVNSEGRPYYPTLLAGGINIEVSTLSVMMIWLLYKHKAIMLLIVMALFYLTQTRAVFVSIASLFIVDKIYLNKDINKLTSKLIIGTIKYTMGLAICIWILYELNLYLSWNLEIYFQRLTSSMGDDPGSQGRLFLYITAFNSSDCFLVGCGVGVASEIIKNSNVFEFFEDNFHNVYLQQLIEVGVLGLVAYMMIFYMAIKRSLLELSDPGLAATITSIFIMGLLQFNGYEILTAFILGLGCSSNAKNVNNHYLCK